MIILQPPSILLDLYGDVPHPGIPKINILAEKVGVAALVENQFPAFVREDHPKFIAFMNAYYRWMENKTGALYDSIKLPDYQDIDTSTDLYTEQFFKEFLVDIPRSLLVDKKLLLKNIRNFYRAKGTEKSYKLFFRMLYNVNVDFYYPRVDILRVSDGKWIQKIGIRVKSILGNVKSLKSKRIRGLTKNATAFVDDVYLIRQGTEVGYELILNQSSLNGTFIDSEVITNEDGTITAEISPTVSDAKIYGSTFAGVGFKVGDSTEIQIYDPNLGRVVSRGTVIVVDEIDPLTGAIIKLKVRRPGFGYTIDELDRTFSFTKDSDDYSPATFIVDYGPLIKYRGYYANTDGQLSADKALHDGEFYQQFSYVLYTDLSAADYKKNLTRLVHPSGLKFFGGFRTQNHLLPKISTAKDHAAVVLKMQHLANAKQNVKKSTITIRHNIIQSSYSFPLGASNFSISREAFKYKPYYTHNASLEMTNTTNENYFGTKLAGSQEVDLSNQLSITPICTFDIFELTPYKIVEHKYRRCHIQPDAVVVSRLSPPWNE